jgi:MFS family permease
MSSPRNAMASQSSPPGTNPPRGKAGYFVLEGMNSFATVYYAYYLYFLTQQAFGFGNRANLALAAVNGLVCMVASFLGGKFADRFGYFTALKLGFGTMMLGLLAGAQLPSFTAQIVIMAIFVVGMCFTWPTLEALVSHGETSASLPRIIGIYNVVWAGAGALAYFTGGALLHECGLKSIYYIPAGIQAVQLGLTLWLEARAQPGASGGTAAISATSLAESDAGAAAKGKTFLNLAWLANPFAYIAINTLVAVMPGVATRLGLSTMLAGFCGSVWCFARVAACLGVWFWDGWH